MSRHRFKSSMRTVVLVAAFIGAGAASAQAVLTSPNDPAWARIGAAGGADYFILPSSVVRDGERVRFLLKAEVPPAPDGVNPNVIVAQTVADCAASAIGTGNSELYNVAQGFMGARRREAAPTPASDPGQALVLQHICTD